MKKSEHYTKGPWCVRDHMHCSEKDGKCFVQRWLKILAKARGEDD